MNEIGIKNYNTGFKAAKKYKKVSDVSTPSGAKNTDKKHWILLGALGAVALGGIIAAGQYNRALKLAEKIDFVPARALDEAKEFAKKNLHIEKFDLKDLDCANYVNEALVNFNNTSKTHRALILSVSQYDGKMQAYAEIVPIYKIGFLSINEKSLKDLACVDNQLKDLQEILSESDIDFRLTHLSDDAKKLYERFKKGEDLSFKERVCLGENISYLKYGPYADPFIAQALNDENIVKYLKENNMPVTLKEYLELNDDKKSEILTSISKNFGNFFKYPDRGEFSTIHHELGHLFHKINIGSKAFNTLDDHLKGKTQAERDESIKKYMKNDALSIVKSQCIGYNAAYGDSEFVAETFAFLKNGGKLCNELMDLYKKLGGVLPENI